MKDKNISKSEENEPKPEVEPIEPPEPNSPISPQAGGSHAQRI